MKGVTDANIFTKADVNGAETRPTYKFLRDHGILTKNIKWNFSGKFIVDKKGNGKLNIIASLFSPFLTRNNIMF